MRFSIIKKKIVNFYNTNMMTYFIIMMTIYQDIFDNWVFLTHSKMCISNKTSSIFKNKKNTFQSYEKGQNFFRKKIK